MNGISRPWYRRPWPMLGAVLVFLVLAALLFLLGEIVYFMVQIKSGKMKPWEAERTSTLRQSIVRALDNERLKPEEMRRLETGTNPTLGNPQAKLRIVEFVDYDCPYSREVAPHIRQYMANHASDTLLVIRDFPLDSLHPQAQDLALAARCVFAQSPVKYWDFHDWLYASQGRRSNEVVLAQVKSYGLDATRFADCLRLREPWPQVQQSMIDGVAFKLEGTPTFFFNGARIQGAVTSEFLEIVADEARKKAASQ